ncbi:MAG TPA: YceI family protein [Sphingomonadaceae bacterium]|nr:YceI family protein [Sphingomonadaceae bacterium]
MMRMFGAGMLAAGLLVSACSQPEAVAPLDGTWALDGAQSTLGFTTVKNGAIAEAHSFSALSGSVGADGAASLTIDLASIATNIDIRDERMREFLFETGTFPSATATAQLDPAAFANLAVGESATSPVSATLDLHGAQQAVDAELTVTRISADKVKVETAAPVIVDAAAFGLDAGVAKLQELAGLDSITPQVPVSFSLVFGKAE